MTFSTHRSGNSVMFVLFFAVQAIFLEPQSTDHWPVWENTKIDLIRKIESLFICGHYTEKRSHKRGRTLRSNFKGFMKDRFQFLVTIVIAKEHGSRISSTTKVVAVTEPFYFFLRVIIIECMSYLAKNHSKNYCCLNDFPASQHKAAYLQVAEVIRTFCGVLPGTRKQQTNNRQNGCCCDPFLWLLSTTY